MAKHSKAKNASLCLEAKTAGGEMELMRMMVGDLVTSGSSTAPNAVRKIDLPEARAGLRERVELLDGTM